MSFTDGFLPPPTRSIRTKARDEHITSSFILGASFIFPKTTRLLTSRRSNDVGPQRACPAITTDPIAIVPYRAARVLLLREINPTSDLTGASHPEICANVSHITCFACLLLSLCLSLFFSPRKSRIRRIDVLISPIASFLRSRTSDRRDRDEDVRAVGSYALHTRARARTCDFSGEVNARDIGLRAFCIAKRRRAMYGAMDDARGTAAISPLCH